MFLYSENSAVVATNFTTSGTANTEVDHLFIKPGVRTIGLQAMYLGGKGAGLTAISGIAYRIKAARTTATTGGGSVITPTPKDPGAQAAKATCSGSASAGFTTPGTGFVYIGGCVSGAAGPGGWVAANGDSMPVCEGGANQSLDVFSASGTLSLNFELNVEHTE